MLLAVTCAACGAAGGSPCRSCLGELRPAARLPPPPGVDDCVALFSYEGAGRALVSGLKFRRNRSAVRGLAAGMASLVGERPDVVTWAPTTPARRRHRGFDQSELLARGVAGELRVPARRLLRRREGPVQTGRTLAERWRTAGFRPARRSPRNVLVIDDVITSGATAAAAAQALRAAGAERVVVLALARTPQADHGG